VALQSIATEYNWFNTQDVFTEASNVKLCDSQQTPNLSTREWEVLFLLGLGITQEEIGAAIGLKRNTVASIIRKQLCSNNIKTTACSVVPCDCWSTNQIQGAADTRVTAVYIKVHK
jgi:DNA-binding NarL/FixJ family response regulator